MKNSQPRLSISKRGYWRAFPAFSPHMPIASASQPQRRTGWRSRRDSNPRYGFKPYNGLANRRLQPLGHSSVFHCRQPMRLKAPEYLARYAREAASSAFAPGAFARRFHSRARHAGLRRTSGHSSVFHCRQPMRLKALRYLARYARGAASFLLRPPARFARRFPFACKARGASEDRRPQLRNRPPFSSLFLARARPCTRPCCRRQSGAHLIPEMRGAGSA